MEEGAGVGATVAASRTQALKGRNSLPLDNTTMIG